MTQVKHMAAIDGQDPSIRAALERISADYGVTASVAKKAKTLLKFGRNPDLGKTIETVWSVGGDETYAAGNTIDEILSTDAEDEQVVVVEGHVLDADGENLTFVTQEVTLGSEPPEEGPEGGKDPVKLGTPLFRATRLYNNDSTDFKGTVTVRESEGEVPHIAADGTTNQSLKCATSLSQTDFWIISSLEVGVLTKKEAAVEFNLEVRGFGKVFRTVLQSAASSADGTSQLTLDPPLIVPPNSDVRVRAKSSIEKEAEVVASLNGYLAGVLY